MRPLLLASIVTAACAIGVGAALPEGTALAAGAGGSGSVATSAYQVTVAGDRARITITLADIRAGEARARGALTPCLLAGFTGLFRSQASSPSPNYQDAVQLLAGEAGAQYVTESLRAELNSEMLETHRLLALNLPARLHRELVLARVLLTRMRSLHACADIKAWEQAGLAPDRAPAGIRNVMAIVREVTELRAPVSIAKLNGLSSAQHATLVSFDRREARHLHQLTAEVSGGLKAWLPPLLIDAERQAGVAPGTQTATTAPTALVVSAIS